MNSLVKSNGYLYDEREKVRVHHAKLLAGLGGDSEELTTVKKGGDHERTFVEEAKGLVERVAVLMAKLQDISMWL